MHTAFGDVNVKVVFDNYDVIQKIFHGTGGSLETIFYKMSSSLSLSFEMENSHILDDAIDDRDEVLHLLKDMMHDPRVALFISDYDYNFNILVKSKENCLQLHKQMRTLKTMKSISDPKWMTVQNIYSDSRKNIAEMKQKINIVYHWLIDWQEEEDKTKAVIAQTGQDIQRMNREISVAKDRTLQDSLNIDIMEELEKQYDQLKAERDNLMTEVEELREEMTTSRQKSDKMETDRLSVENDIIETQKGMVRVANEISKYKQQKASMQAAYQADYDCLQVREKDMLQVRFALLNNEEDCKRCSQKARDSSVQAEQRRTICQEMDTQLHCKVHEYHLLSKNLLALEKDVRKEERKLSEVQLDQQLFKENLVDMDEYSVVIQQTIQDVIDEKLHTSEQKEIQAKKNQALMEEIRKAERNKETAEKQEFAVLRLRDELRKKYHSEKNAMDKIQKMTWLHRISCQRLKRDNGVRVAENKDKKKFIKKLQQESANYTKQTAASLRKTLKLVNYGRKETEKICDLEQQRTQEQLELNDKHNAYEITLHEHTLASVAILKFRNILENLSMKCRSLQSVIDKLVEEVDLREELIVKEAVNTQKVNRQIFLLKINLTELKESNLTMKVALENQTVEEKKLLDILKMMGTEKVRERKGLEVVNRDMDWLNLNLMKREQELREAYELVRVKQSELEKGQNRYHIRLNGLLVLAAELRQTKALRKLDEKSRRAVTMIRSIVKIFKNKVELVQLRSERLKEELSHPKNIHRWRSLQSGDPDAYAAIQSLNKLRCKIQLKLERVTEADNNLHRLDLDYIHLNARLNGYPGPITVLQLKNYKNDLDELNTQNQILTEHLQEALEEKANAKASHTAVRQKMWQMKQQWEKKARRTIRRQLQQKSEEDKHGQIQTV